jgi:hypothetical protein
VKGSVLNEEAIRERERTIHRESDAQAIECGAEQLGKAKAQAESMLRRA